MTVGHIAGAYHAQWCFRNSDGYPMGTQSSPDSVANGTTTHARKLTGLVEAAAMQISRETATFKGGQALLGKRQLGVSDLGDFMLKLSAYDPIWHAFINRNAVDTTTVTGNVLSAPNLGEGDPPQGMLLLTTGYTPIGGANKFLTYAYHNVQISPTNLGGASQGGGENPNPLEYTVTALPADRTFLGLPFADTDLVVVDNTDWYTLYESQYPVGLTTYVALGSATSFILGYRPKSSDVAQARNSFTKNGAISAPTSCNTTTGSVVIPSATAADIWVAVYETLFQAI